jgi:pimeloyl-ACP methyl ester carboxylesterase
MVRFPLQIFVLLAFYLGLPNGVRAETYSLSIVFKDGDIINGEPITCQDGEVHINNKGTITFMGSDQNGYGIFTPSKRLVGNGDSLGGVLVNIKSPGYPYSLNDSDQVSFWNSGPQGDRNSVLNTASGLVAFPGQVFTSGTLASIFYFSLDNNGVTTFEASYGQVEGIFNDQGILIPYNSTINGMTGVCPEGSMTTSGNDTLAFAADIGEESAQFPEGYGFFYNGDLVATDGSVIAGCTVTGLENYNRFGLNNTGMFVFQANYVNEQAQQTGLFSQNGLLVSTGSSISSRVLTQIVYHDDWCVRVNDTGTIAFLGNFLGLGAAVCTQDDIVAASGSVVKGGTIGSFGDPSINNSGAIACLVTIESGTSAYGAVLLATPTTTNESWIAPQSGLWADSANWSKNAVPVTTDDVFIQPSTALTVTGPTSSTEVASLTIGDLAGTATLALNSSQTLTVDGALTITSGGSLWANGSTVRVGSLSNTGDLLLSSTNPISNLWVSGTFSAIQNSETDIAIDGTKSTQYSQIHVTGASSLSGSLTAILGRTSKGEYVPKKTDKFEILTTSGIDGAFNSGTASRIQALFADSEEVAGTFRMDYNAESAVLTDFEPAEHIVLLLHGLDGEPASWNDFIRSLEASHPGLGIDCPVILNGHVDNPPKPTPVPGFIFTSPFSAEFLFYRINFGAYDTTSGLYSLSSNGGRGTRATKAEHGDYETLDELGKEVDQAVAAILDVYPDASITLVGHSRGGLAGRAFLQNPSYANEIAAVVGFITLGTPHNGSYLGKIHDYLVSHDKKVDPETWKLLDTAKDWPFNFDALVPSIGFLATDGTAITDLSTNAANLPTNISYLNYCYTGINFGDVYQETATMPEYKQVFLGNPFLFKGFGILRYFSPAAQNAMLGQLWPTSLSCDGVVQADSQSLLFLPDFAANHSLVVLTDTNGVFHTFEHDQPDDLVNALKISVGWNVSP